VLVLPSTLTPKNIAPITNNIALKMLNFCNINYEQRNGKMSISS
jgi:hypothetical protein